MSRGGDRRTKRSPRFERLMAESGRDLNASRPVLAVFRAEWRLSEVLDTALAPSGLTPPKFNVLMELAASRSGGLPLHEVSRRLLKSAPNVTGLIDRLEADGLVRRVRDEEDRRVVHARITARGWRRLGEAAPHIFAAEKRALVDLDVAARDELVGLLDRLASRAPQRPA